MNEYRAIQRASLWAIGLTTICLAGCGGGCGSTDGHTPPAPIFSSGHLIPPDDPALRDAFTPGVWRVAAVSGGTTEAMAINLDAEVTFRFTGMSLALGVDTSRYGHAPAVDYPELALTVDGGPERDVRLTPGQRSVTVASGLTTDTHSFLATYKMVGTMKQDAGVSDWNGGADGPGMALRLTGFQIDPTPESNRRRSPPTRSSCWATASRRWTTSTPAPGGRETPA